MTTSRRALVLLAHGSPDPEWMAPIDGAAARIKALAADVDVAIATLEASHASLDAAVDALAGAGHRSITIVALFLSPGGRHIKRDIPDLVAAAQAARPGLELRLVPGALGNDPQVLDALARAALAQARGEPTAR